MTIMVQARDHQMSKVHSPQNTSSLDFQIVLLYIAYCYILLFGYTVYLHSLKAQTFARFSLILVQKFDF